ncbi:MAG: sulfite exporter TauE/SafE family protein [Deltaproteobacteria bacterium]|nr:sulfite exporter TauE/SafE family protein [Deltaproteobacteria bacterium]
MDIPIDPLLFAVLIPSFFLVAAAYASVGLGGGSGYLAIMALLSVPFEFMPSTSQALNIVVTATALARYGLVGRINPRLFLPFLLPALPAAFLGGMVDVPKSLFMGSMGIMLTLAAVAMFVTASTENRKAPSALMIWALGLPAGFGVGFLSGFLGIGGGVFLGPLILLLGWAGPRETAPMNSLLVLMVSAFGLVGQGIRGTISLGLLAPLAAAVLLGGLVGSHVGETRLSAANLKRVLATIVLVAGLRAVLVALGI